MVIEKAKELGQALIDSPEFKAYAAARDDVEGDLAASNLMRAYAEKEQEIAQSLSQKPVDREEINRLSEQLKLLREKMSANDMISYYTKVKGEFQNLINTANSIIAHFINPDADPEGESCGGKSGGCTDCSGCGRH